MEVSYEPLGSERGFELLVEGAVDFPVTEVPLSEAARLSTYEIPMAVDAMVLVAGLDGIDAINFTHDLIV